MTVKGGEKISTQYLLVRHCFLRRKLGGVVILVVNWGQSMGRYHVTIPSGTKPFKPFPGKGMGTPLQGFMYSRTPVTDTLYRKVCVLEPTRKVNSGIDIICLFSPQTGQCTIHLVVPNGTSWLQK